MLAHGIFNTYAGDKYRGQIVIANMVLPSTTGNTFSKSKVICIITFSITHWAT